MRVFLSGCAATPVLIVAGIFVAAAWVDQSLTLSSKLGILGFVLLLAFLLAGLAVSVAWEWLKPGRDR